MGLNIGHLQTSADGNYAYFPWMVYADRPITAGNIREGWVMGNRVAACGSTARPDARRWPSIRAAGPWAIRMAWRWSPDEKWLAISASGTHELVVFRLADLPLRSDGPGDHLKPEIAGDDERFFRVPAGWPAAGHSLRSLGPAACTWPTTWTTRCRSSTWTSAQRRTRDAAGRGRRRRRWRAAARRSFYDANRSADGWYSCHSCHYEGDTNAVTMDTKNDGSFGTYKMVLSLRNVRHTGPWFWHGWQNDLQAALRKSLGDTMQGPRPATTTCGPWRRSSTRCRRRPTRAARPMANCPPQAASGKRVFESAAAACANCHSGPYLTDGEIHDVGLASSTTSTRATTRRRWSASAIGPAICTTAGPSRSTICSPTCTARPRCRSTRELTAEEQADLVEYLRRCRRGRMHSQLSADLVRRASGWRISCDRVVRSIRGRGRRCRGRAGS